MRNFQKGFTLIELMVVISIIGMLSSLILTGLQTTRVKARNSRIVQDVQQLRNQIELGKNGDTYPSLMRSSPSSGVDSTRIAKHATFISYPGITALVTDILAQNGFTYSAGYGGSVRNGGSPNCTNRYAISPLNDSVGLTIYVDTPVMSNECGSATKYAIYAAMSPMTTPGSGYFCIDSLGRTTRTTVGYIPISSGGTDLMCL